MQATSLFYHFGTRPEVKVVGIAKDDLRLDLIAQFVLMDSPHCAYSAYRHENRGFDQAVGSLYFASTGSRIRVGMLKLKSQCLRDRGLYGQKRKEMAKASTDTIRPYMKTV